MLAPTRHPHNDGDDERYRGKIHHNPPCGAGLIQDHPDVEQHVSGGGQTKNRPGEPDAYWMMSERVSVE